jgi:hypothetical protein
MPRGKESKERRLPPTPFSREGLDVIEKKGSTKHEGNYPTISMIMNGLLENLRKAGYYFQYYSLWKSLEPPRTKN